MDNNRICRTALTWQPEGTTKNNLEKDNRDRKRHNRDEQMSKGKDSSHRQRHGGSTSGQYASPGLKRIWGR
jgi:hypothetical protein